MGGGSLGRSRSSLRLWMQCLSALANESSEHPETRLHVDPPAAKLTLEEENRMQPLRVFPPALLLALAIGPAGAETLYNQDGVQLTATARVIDPEAATCRIREERHTAEQYEKLKPNHGQPLDVWRVELVVANYSGKTLDYLSAHVNVESSWPPCDNWDGPEAHYGAPVVWTGPLMSIQEVGAVEPGEEVHETAFVLAWHEEEPVLGRWDINYDFAAGADAAAAPRTERPADVATRDAATERSTARFEPEETCAGKEVGASCWMEAANQPECYLWNPNLEKEETVTWSGECSGGRASGTGERTWSYTDFLGKLASSSGTGELRDGKENGHWTTRLASGLVGEGPWVDGKPHGYHVLRFPGDGGLIASRVEEGPYVDGHRHGRWTERHDDGLVKEGAYVNGKKHGFWTSRLAEFADPDDWNIEPGKPWRYCYRNGENRGRWDSEGRFWVTCPP